MVQDDPVAGEEDVPQVLPAPTQVEAGGGVGVLVAAGAHSASVGIVIV